MGQYLKPRGKKIALDTKILNKVGEPRVSRSDRKPQTWGTGK